MKPLLKVCAKCYEECKAYQKLHKEEDTCIRWIYPPPSQSFDLLLPRSILSPLPNNIPPSIIRLSCGVAYFQCCLAPESSQSLLRFPVSRSLHTAASVIDIPLGEASPLPSTITPFLKTQSPSMSCCTCHDSKFRFDFISYL